MLTVLIRAASRGDRGAEAELLRAVYSDLRAIARRKTAPALARAGVQATAVVHEAFLKLFRGARTSFADRKSFFAAASRVIGRQVVDEWRRVSLRRTEEITDEHPAPGGGRARLEQLALREHMIRFAETYPRAARVVEMRFLRKLTNDEIATRLGIGRATAARDLRFARSWFLVRLDRSA